MDELKAAGEGVNPMRLGEQVVAKTVCRHAVKANDPLSEWPRHTGADAVIHSYNVV